MPRVDTATRLQKNRVFHWIHHDPPYFTMLSFGSDSRGKPKGRTSTQISDILRNARNGWYQYIYNIYIIYIIIYVYMCVLVGWIGAANICKCPPAKKCQFIPKLDLQLNESGKQLASGDCSCGFARVPPFEMTTRCKITNMLNKHMSLEGRAWRSKTPHYRPHPTSLDFLHKRYERRWWWSLTPVS